MASIAIPSSCLYLGSALSANVVTSCEHLVHLQEGKFRCDYCNYIHESFILRGSAMATGTEACLAFLALCLYASIGRQRKSLYRLLLLTLAMLLGTAVAGVLQLIYNPAFFLEYCL